MITPEQAGDVRELLGTLLDYTNAACEGLVSGNQHSKGKHGMHWHLCACSMQTSTHEYLAAVNISMLKHG